LLNLIRAWKEALNSHPSILNSWMLAIAGWDQGGHEAQLRQLTTDLRLLTSVIFLGPRFGADRDACYRACDAFVLPSLSEGLPMTVLEAWAYAKPVLMTSECNLPEGFVAGAALQTGTTSKQIAARLKQLIEMSDDDRRAMGARGRALVAETFSWPRIGEQMRWVYEWVLGGGTAPETIRL
jgi:poly(glycerol-phosphate) alpha-glucosyltransferase